MTSWVHVETGHVPGEKTTLHLMRQGEAYAIKVGGQDLMRDQHCESERALATLVAARLQDRPQARVLIGGLGMGFTLRAALDAFGPEAEIVVAELVPAVVAWARGPLAHLFAGSLDEARVALHEADVNRLIQSGPATFDAILLDVDNGPEGMVSRENDRLYDSWGLKRAHYALRPGGVLGVWSGRPDRKFKARLARSGFNVEEVRVPSRQTGEGPRNVLWLATRTGPPVVQPLPAAAGTRPDGTGSAA